MFTGIIEAQGKVLATHKHGGRRTMRITKPSHWKLQPGESVSVDGVCSTVGATGVSFFEVEYMPETLKKTTLGLLKKNDSVNLERSLRVGDRVSGHFVQGHVDARCAVAHRTKRGGSYEIALRTPARLSRLLPAQGSVAVNGVSLTIAKKTPGGVTIALIPHTLTHTNLSSIEADDLVNVEVDMLARYATAA